MLVVMAVSALTVILLLELTRCYQPDPRKEEKGAAMELMQSAIHAIKTEKLRMGIPIDRLLDPDETGMIGVEYNDLTTTRGSLTSKRISTNPAFAAVVVEMLDQAGVGTGDPVAVSFSGSFPALNIAVLSAVKVLNLQPVIISSAGASMYGANQPEMTWLDMERILAERGIFPYRSLAASLGGITDTQGGLDGTGISTGLRAIRRNGRPLLTEGGVARLDGDIRERMALFDRSFGGQKPAAFVNVGGSLTSLGSGPGVHQLPMGLLMKIPASGHLERGIIFRMAERGVPVVHLLKIRSIAAQYGIPVDPAPWPVVPPGRKATPKRYSMPLAVACLVLLMVILAFLHRADVKSRATGGA